MATNWITNHLFIGIAKTVLESPSPEICGDAVDQCSFIVLCLSTAVAKGYKKNKGKAPSGIQSFFEPIIVFVRDEV